MFFYSKFLKVFYVEFHSHPTDGRGWKRVRNWTIFPWLYKDIETATSSLDWSFSGPVTLTRDMYEYNYWQTSQIVITVDAELIHTLNNIFGYMIQQLVFLWGKTSKNSLWCRETKCPLIKDNLMNEGCINLFKHGYNSWNITKKTNISLKITCVKSTKIGNDWCDCGNKLDINKKLTYTVIFTISKF